MTIHQYFIIPEGVVTLSDDAPEWLLDAVREAHDDELPDNWRWEKCAAIVEAHEEGEDDPFVIASSLVDIYTSDLLRWLTPARLHWLDEAVANYGFDTSFNTLQAAQSLCLENMASILIEAIADNTDNEEDCDRCGEPVPNGHGHYIDNERVCGECQQASNNDKETQP